MKKEIEMRIEASKNLKNERREFIKTIREENAREWQSILDNNEAVYVYHSLNDADDVKACGYHLRKVTVVCCVKAEDDGTYSMNIGWARLHHLDTYNRKVGNIIAARRANNPTESFEFNGCVMMPMVLKGFATDILKDNFMPIAAAIVQMYEDVYDFEEDETLESADDFDIYQHEKCWATDIPFELNDEFLDGDEVEDIEESER